ncbi:RCC1 and BTB domain-containing protein 1 [Folsomia candida]|uniref:RCC1 and BTB domain-containing protein 1 n=1 Tax=Folsomia candida TaxID=158441 RepID=A0A226EBK5_FOLCA|nr:RCC1 and BTB domain-containing protein 1 [Folsomia candida]OXA54820.1 RCC1 and BTB domain-containing protein 1 [Folsomia candida]
MASSSGIIPRDKLQIWEIFRNPGHEGEEILKTSKLAHVVDQKHGLVVTIADETYSFFRDEGGCKITRIPNLCGVRVKEFFIVNIGVGLAIAEDGSLYSWINDFFLLQHLDTSQISFDIDPHVVGGSLIGRKVQQVALAGERVMALTVGGDVHHWVRIRDMSFEPILIAKKNFDYQEVISIACSDDISIALTSNGEVFQWELGNMLPQKVIVAPLRKIIGISHIIFALTVEGALYSARFYDPISRETKPVWTLVFENLKSHDITTSVSDDVVVVELKNNIRLAFSYRGGTCDPHILSISPNVTSLDDLFAEISQTTCRTIWAKSDVKPGTVEVDIANLWGSKENSDVTFSVEGKTISAHKLVLTARSEYFAKMFSNEWKEMKGSSIEIKDTRYEIFEALLFYIYCDKVTFSKDEYENIFGLMMLADAHCAIKIRHECEQILMRNITTENAVFLIRNAASANASDLEMNVVRFILDNRLLDVNLSPQAAIDLLGIEGFNKVWMAALRRL